MHKVTLIPGDGVGPEITEATRRVLDASGAGLEWEVMQAGENVMAEHGTPLPEAVLESVRRNRVGLKGPITTPVGKGIRSVNVALRHALELYSCLRPIKLYQGAQTRYPAGQVDFVIVRENSEDLYAGVEFAMGEPDTIHLIDELNQLQPKQIRKDSGISIKPISETATRRIVHYAFKYAQRYGRRKVTAVHKANIMKYTDGLFLRVAGEVATEYPGIEFEDRIVDNLCMQLVMRPQEYDVLVLPNLYGDIISDLGAGLIGGLGLAPGGNIGDEYAVFEPTHGSAPKYTGLDKMNPMAMMLSGVMMLRHLGEDAAADRVEGAIADVVREGRFLTYDMKATRDDPTAVGTARVADAIIERMSLPVPSA
ncbi:MAG: isocitrate/isopropylmalate dehydrogenase family protein [Candidatus Dormibacteria bacterium]